MYYLIISKDVTNANDHFFGDTNHDGAYKASLSLPPLQAGDGASFRGISYKT